MAHVVDTSRRSRRARAADVLDERLGLKALQYPVPEHANNLAWSLGGLTAAALFILIATGIFLAQFYNPSPEAANASVREIVTGVWAGRFIRGVHYWTAQAMYILAALHLLRVFFTGSYKRPREANWLIGVSMFALVIGALFTGTVLKWDQEGFEALGHNLEIARLLGGAGFWFNPNLAAHVPLLERLTVAHIAIIPGLILGLFAVHGMLVKRHGISPSPTVPDEPGEVREPFTTTFAGSAPSLSFCSPSSVCSPSSFRQASGRHRSKASKSPSRCGRSGGCSHSRTRLGSKASSTVPASCSRCCSRCRSSIATQIDGGANGPSPLRLVCWCLLASLSCPSWRPSPPQSATLGSRRCGACVSPTGRWW